MWPRGSGTQVLNEAPPPAGAAPCTGDEASPLSIYISAGEVNSHTDLDSLVSFSLDSTSSCSVPKHLEHTWTCVTPGGGQLSLQEEQRKRSLLSLTQRVQVNRRILQQLLTNQTHLDDSQSQGREQSDAGQSLFVSAWLPQQQQCEDGAHMKRRCVPLRGDHNLLTPDTHTLLGVRLPPVIQVKLEASHSGHLSDLSSSQLAVGLTRRHPVASPTRRLRFEDETEMEAESRYLERQKQGRWVGQRGTGILVSKPDLNLYINSRAEAGHDFDRQQRGLTSAGGVGIAGQCDSCGTVLRGGANLNLLDGRGRSLYRPHVNLRTEPIRETYIGSVKLGETRPPCRGGVAGHVSNTQMRRSTNQVELNGNQVTSTTDLPINPYAPDQLITPTFRCPFPLSPPTVASAMMSQSIRLNSIKAEQDLNQDQKEQGRPTKPHSELRTGAELRVRSPCVEEVGVVDLRMKNSSSSSSERSSETTAASRAPPSSDEQVKDPIRAELHSDDASIPEHFSSRDESSRLSLRRLFSTIRLSRTRTGSLDRLSNRPHPSTYDPTPSRLLKKCPSVQSLNEQGSPFLQLRKLSSVQTFGSEQKKKDRSADYRPAADRFLQRCLSVEDVGSPCSLRSVGRVLEASSDGTFLLELSRPTTQTYGFVISRGRGRPDSGVYVEDMVDSSTEKLYAGLLSVGDEILEVNGEKVACLSLDQVTHLLTQNISATVRVLRHLKTVPR